MTFTKRLHAGILAGTITSSVRVWQAPHVKVGGTYRFADGAIEVTGLRELKPEQVTDRLARRTGFDDANDLMRVAKHGPGWRIFLVDFVYRPPLATRKRKAKTHTH